MKSHIRSRALGSAALIFTGVLALSACGQAPDSDGGDSADSTAAPESDFLACAVSDEGSWNDRSFNEAAYGGLIEAERDLGVSIQDLESSGTEDFQPNLDASVDSGCDVTFAVGFNFSENDIMFSVAEANADSDFVWIDGWQADPALDNLKPVQYEMAESSFLAGYLAAAFSETGVVGTYGGMDIEAVTVFMEGFENGALYYAAETGSDITVVGLSDFVGDFANSGVARSITEGQLTAGADVIFPVAGGLFTASVEAIREQGGNAVIIGVDKNIAETNPDLADVTLTSVEKRMTQAVFDIIESLYDGNAFDNEPYVGTLANDGTALSPFGDFEDQVDDEVKAQIEEIRQAIIDGDIDPLATP